MKIKIYLAGILILLLFSSCDGPSLAKGPEIHITSPTGEIAYYSGSECLIEWTTEITGEMVCLELYNGDEFLETIAASAALGDRKFSWSIGNIKTGQEYNIKLTLLTGIFNNENCKSNDFTISRARWTDLGSPGEDDCKNVSIALGNDNRPLIMYLEEPPENNPVPMLRTRAWNGNSWDSLGNLCYGMKYYYSMAVGSDYNPVAVYQSGAWEIKKKKGNESGDSWEYIEDSLVWNPEGEPVPTNPDIFSIMPYYTFGLSLAMHMNTPYVALFVVNVDLSATIEDLWNDYLPFISVSIQMRKEDDPGNWNLVGGGTVVTLEQEEFTGLLAKSGSNNPIIAPDSELTPELFTSLAINEDKQPFVAYNTCGDEVSNLHVRTLTEDGNSWIKLGYSKVLEQQAENPSLAIAADGYPVVTYRDITPTAKGKARVKKWTGIEWLDISYTDSAQDVHPSVCKGRGNTIIVAAEDGVRSWDGKNWTLLAYTSSGHNAGNHSWWVAANEDICAIAYIDEDDQHKVCVKTMEL